MGVQPQGREDPLEEGMATHPSILTWRIPWTEEPGGLQSVESQESGHDWSDLAHMQISLACEMIEGEVVRVWFLYVSCRNTANLWASSLVVLTMDDSPNSKRQFYLGRR